MLGSTQAFSGAFNVSKSQKVWISTHIQGNIHVYRYNADIL